MVKSKKFIILILQLCLMGVFVLGTYTFSKKELQLTDVYVYTKKLNINAELEQSDLKRMQVPYSAVSNKFLTQKEYDEIGKGNKVIKSNVEAGEYAYKSHIGDSDKIDPFEQIDLSKYRKVTIKVTYDSAVAGEISKGDTVDLAFVKELETTDGDGKGYYSNIFMQDVLVYGVSTSEGFEYVEHTQVKKGQVSSSEDENTLADYEGSIAMVTFAVPINDAEEIIARNNSGSIVIVGRFEDSIDSESPGYYIGNDSPTSIYSGDKKVERGN